MQARLAEKRKEFAKAEQFWRRAVELAPAEPGPSSPAGRDGIRAGRLADLARFLARQQRFPESDAAFEQAAKLAPDKADLKFARARTYLDAKRNRELARRLLEEYLKSPLTPDDPPRAEAERLLRSLGRAG
jgi:tetratricopeptide (TPR) repeat protein